MEAQIPLGRVRGIKLGLHYSWLIIAALIVLSLAPHFRQINPGWSEAVVWSAAVLTGIFFFGGILLHELGHAMVANARGVPVHSIVLFALGGVSQMEKESHDARSEFWIGIAGPLVSVALGGIFLLLAHALGWPWWKNPHTPVTAVLVWLGYINWMLAGFNMIPGYPLDGGRVLRAAVWWWTGNMERSTRIAAGIGQLVAFGFILWGIWQFFGGYGIGGLWLAFIGWFLLDASRASYAQVQAMRLLEGVRVRDVMTRDCALVDMNASLQSLADELLRTGQRCFVVESQGHLAGLITAGDIGRVDRDDWPVTPVGRAMRPLDKLRVVAPETPVTQALETMARDNVNQLPVVSNGNFQGIFSRAHLLQLLQARSELLRQ